MPRIARVVVPGIPLHVTQRGIRRTDVFADDTDRLLYHWLLKTTAAHFQLRFYAYCLMTNHVHFVVVPGRPDSLWKTIHRVHSVYSYRFNRRQGLSGHLWQGRPFSCPLDDTHLWAAVRYVERNPVRTGIVERAEDYIWSSASAHCNGDIDDLLDPNWPATDEITEWSSWLTEEDVQEVERVRKSTFSGKPCRNEAFVRWMEAH